MVCHNLTSIYGPYWLRNYMKFSGLTGFHLIFIMTSEHHSVSKCFENLTNFKLTDKTMNGQTKQCISVLAFCDLAAVSYFANSLPLSICCQLHHCTPIPQFGMTLKISHWLAHGAGILLISVERHRCELFKVSTSKQTSFNLPFVLLLGVAHACEVCQKLNLLYTV